MEKQNDPATYGVEDWTTEDWLHYAAGRKKLPQLAEVYVEYLAAEAAARRANGELVYAKRRLEAWTHNG